jgi:hypothetical protein
VRIYIYVVDSSGSNLAEGGAVVGRRDAVFYTICVSLATIRSITELCLPCHNYVHCASLLQYSTCVRLQEEKAECSRPGRRRKLTSWIVSAGPTDDKLVYWGRSEGGEGIRQGAA